MLSLYQVSAVGTSLWAQLFDTSTMSSTRVVVPLASAAEGSCCLLVWTLAPLVVSAVGDEEAGPAEDISPHHQPCEPDHQQQQLSLLFTTTTAWLQGAAMGLAHNVKQPRIRAMGALAKPVRKLWTAPTWTVTPTVYE